MAFLFPGQGSQKVDLLNELPSLPVVGHVKDEASRILGESVYNFHTQDSLKSTKAVQISLFVAGIASFKVYESTGLTPDFVAGHSVGAFSAATAAGVMHFEDALKLVKLRGELMEKAYPTGYGMGVVLGLEVKKLRNIIEDNYNESSPVYMSNQNATDQITISGSLTGIKKILDRSKENGARCASILNVPTPSHCPLLSEISTSLREALYDIPLYRPKIPYAGNFNARLLYNPVDIRLDLAESVSSPVRWHDATSVLYEKGARLFVELLPGNVLSRLAAKAFPDARVISMEVNGVDDCLYIIQREISNRKKN